MSNSAADRIVLSDGATDPQAGIAHAAAPFMIGLVGAVVGMALLAPGMLRHGTLIASALLIPTLIVSVGIYAWSVLSPGDIVGLIVDRAKREIEVVQANAFATRRTRVDFVDVAGVRLEATFDRDGYESRACVMTLSSGERLILAFATSEAHLAELRAALGLPAAR